MTQPTSTSTISSAELKKSLDLVEVRPGLKFSKQILMDLLPDAETALFFGKVYDLDHVQVSAVLGTVLKTDLADALFNQSHVHSTELQTYLVDICDQAYGGTTVTFGTLKFDSDPIKDGEILTELWKSQQVTIAQAIKDVAKKLEGVVGMLPGKQGEMVFKSMMKMNTKRPTVGVHQANITHPLQKQNLLILDVSGSMTHETVSTIVDDVVALSYMANAHMAIVSNDCTYWEPGTYGTPEIMAAATFGGTQYEKLAPLFDRDWGAVITVADYDSSRDAKRVIAGCNGRIDEVIDISLVNVPTFMAECVGQLASKVTPILIGRSEYVLGSTWDENYAPDTSDWWDDDDPDNDEPDVW